VSAPTSTRLTNAAAPLYKKVKLYVLDMIESRKWLPKSRLPGEPELAQQLDVSRLTINRALRELATEGVVDRIPGVGTFISSKNPSSASDIVEIHNIADVIQIRGQIYSCSVIRLALVLPPQAVRVGLKVTPGAHVFHAAVVHRADRVPLQLEERYVIPDFAPKFIAQDFTKITTTQYLSAIVKPTGTDYVIEAAMLDASSVELLEMAVNEPALVVKRRTWVSDRITTYTKLTHPGSRYRLIGITSERS
jgi:GntR family histidine utilization transcriptional repressor